MILYFNLPQNYFEFFAPYVCEKKCFGFFVTIQLPKVSNRVISRFDHCDEFCEGKGEIEKHSNTFLSCCALLPQNMLSAETFTTFQFFIFPVFFVYLLIFLFFYTKISMLKSKRYYIHYDFRIYFGPNSEHS